MGQSFDLGVDVGKIAIYLCCFFSTFAFGLAASEPRAGKAAAAYMPQQEIMSTAARTHFETLAKTRPLSVSEKELQNLLMVAAELKVDKFLSPSNDPATLGFRSITDAMILTMRTHPMWDVAVISQKNEKVGNQLELLNKVFGAKSYGRAWFLKQRGEKAEAKRVLLEVFEQGHKNVMQMSDLGYGGPNPLNELQYVRTALEPMCGEKEMAALDLKIQQIKNHLSNLPPSNIQT